MSDHWGGWYRDRKSIKTLPEAVAYATEVSKAILKEGIVNQNQIDDLLTNTIQTTIEKNVFHLLGLRESNYTTERGRVARDHPDTPLMKLIVEKAQALAPEVVEQIGEVPQFTKTEITRLKRTCRDALYDLVQQKIWELAEREADSIASGIFYVIRAQFLGITEKESEEAS